MKKIISIIGARPQFIKHAPMQLQLQKLFNALTIHTGQHYDKNMSDIFFRELGIEPPNFIFDIGGSKPQGEQTGIMMTEIEKVCNIEKPDAILVYGDTNSTLAGTLVAAKNDIPLIHVEAGLRSYNRRMPEEVNRIIADEFSYMLFCPTKIAVENLNKEGIEHERIYICGDVMADTINLVKDKVEKKVDFPYYFATIHRPYNTDDSERLKELLNHFQNLNQKVIFAVHPRTLARIESFCIEKESLTNIKFIEPVGYLDSISYQSFSTAVITDSGGIQKEAYILKKKCITLRSETEWTETLENGWNHLLFEDLGELQNLINKNPGIHKRDLFGNGDAASDIVKIINSNL